jgi:uncharacterized protein YndB with AHSA1/START domain
MNHNKVTLHRVFTASPEKIYRAFTEADALTSWLPPNGFSAKVHELDFKVGAVIKCLLLILLPELRSLLAVII